MCDGLNGGFIRRVWWLQVRGKKGDEVFDTDEGPRPATTLESLGRLPTVFKKDGVVTAGTASGITDGAAAMVIASEGAAKEHGLTPLARVVSWGMYVRSPSTATRASCMRHIPHAFAVAVVCVPHCPSAPASSRPLWGEPRAALPLHVLGTSKAVLTRACPSARLSVSSFGPVPAIRMALERANLSLDDMDLVEVNEAFGAQYVAGPPYRSTWRVQVHRAGHGRARSARPRPGNSAVAAASTLGPHAKPWCPRVRLPPGSSPARRSWG